MIDREQRLRREIARRYRLRAACEDDPGAQALVLEQCSRAPIQWINDWVWTYDPRNGAKGLPVHLPFRLYPRQADLVDWVRERRDCKENGAVEKARGTGATYTGCGYTMWLWLFEDAVSVKWGSRTQADVDQQGNPDSIFERLRIILYRLPRWMRPAGFDREEHDNQQRLLNPATGAHVIGQQGSNMGRGGRSSLYFWDESASHDHPRKVERSVKENTDCLIEISTHRGPNTPFSRKVEARSVDVLQMPWHSVPWRDQAWYDSKKEDYAHDPVGFARNIDMDAGGSEERVVIPKKWVEAAVEIDLITVGRSDGGLDVGESNDLNVFISRLGSVVTGIDDWGGRDTTQTARKVVELGEQRWIDTLFYDAIGIGAGVTGELKNWEPADDADEVGEAALPFDIEGVNTGEDPTRQTWPNDKRSDEWLVNLKAELWWRLRERFRKTFERLYGDGDYHDDECISIPDHGELKSQLTWPKYERGRGGKRRIESKEQTKTRLETDKSYDYADALVLAFAGDVLGQAGVGILV